MNNITIHGRLTRDPELKYLPTGDPVCNFSIAENYAREKANFHDCSAFGKTAELIAAHFSKGKEIIVSGRIEQREYEKDGNKRRVHEIKVREIDFCGSKADGDAGHAAPHRDADAPLDDLTDPFADQ